MRKLVSLLLLVGSAWCTATTAETVDDVQSAKVGSAALVLNGMGLNTFLREERAVGALYLESKSADPETIATSAGHKRMEMRIITSRLSARNFAQQWSEGISLNNSGEDWRNHATQIVAFARMFQQNLTTGDHVVIDYLPEVGTQVSVNGSVLGTVPGMDLYPLLLRTWIGKVPPSEAFKAGILGQSADKALAERFVNLQLSETRIAEMKKAEDARKKVEEEAKLAEEKKKKEEEERLANEKKAKEEGDRVAKLEVEKAALQKQLEAQKKVAAAAAPTAAVPVAAPAATAASGDTPKAADQLSQYLVRSRYEKTLLKAVRSKMEYPPLAFRRKIEGSAILRVNINRQGQVQKTVMELSSGKPILDDAALKMVQSASPLPAIPTEISDGEFEFLVPISFKLSK